jgi:hypothetical protein
VKLAFNVRTRVAWWVKPFLFAVAMYAWLTQRPPNLQRVMRWALRGISADIDAR